MSTTITNFNHEFPFSAVDTYDYTIQTSATHKISVKVTDYNTTAGISLQIKNGSSTLATLSAGQVGGELNLQVLNNAAANDVIHVVVASTTGNDVLGNQIRGFITITRLAG